MEDRFIRTQLMFGECAVNRLKKSKVLVFGIGGVGGYAVEALARSGVGEIHVCDSDVVSESNINRQILALTSTIGRLKTDVCEERIKDINPDCVVKKFPVFYLPESECQFDFALYDYVLDATDTVSAKLAIVENACRAGTPVISAMGAGNKLEPTMFEVADIYATSVCPLARVMRRELKKRGIKSLKVVYSKEQPVKHISAETQTANSVSERFDVPASNSFTPSVAGLIMAGEVIKDLMNKV